MHIELTEMLRCPEPHELAFLVLSTGEMLGRSVRFGLVGCPVCRHEYRIIRGVVDFSGSGKGEEGSEKREAGSGPATPVPADSTTLQALLDLSGPGGFVVLVGSAARHAVGLSQLMGGIHFVGINPPAGSEELPMLSLLRAPATIPLRPAIARAVVLGDEVLAQPWVGEAVAVLLRGRRFVVEREAFDPPPGITRLASGGGLWVGEKQ